MVRVTCWFSSVEKTYSLNNENKSSIAIGGKINPKEEKKNEIIGGIKCGRFAFCLNIFDAVKNNISASAEMTI